MHHWGKFELSLLMYGRNFGTIDISLLDLLCLIYEPWISLGTAGKETVQVTVQQT